MGDVCAGEIRASKVLSCESVTRCNIKGPAAILYLHQGLYCNNKP